MPNKQLKWVLKMEVTARNEVIHPDTSGQPRGRCNAAKMVRRGGFPEELGRAVTCHYRLVLRHFDLR